MTFKMEFLGDVMMIWDRVHKKAAMVIGDPKEKIGFYGFRFHLEDPSGFRRMVVHGALV